MLNLGEMCYHTLIVMCDVINVESLGTVCNFYLQFNSIVAYQPLSRLTSSLIIGLGRVKQVITSHERLRILRMC